MTDRIHSFTVVLEENMRTDDAEVLQNAIAQLRGVLSVDANVSDFSEHIAERRVRHELGSKLMSLLYPPKGGA